MGEFDSVVLVLVFEIYLDTDVTINNIDCISPPPFCGLLSHTVSDLTNTSETMPPTLQLMIRTLQVADLDFTTTTV